MMNETEILQRIVGYLSEQFAVSADSITMETSFIGDLNADSLRLIEMAMHVEETLGVRVQDDDIRTLESVGDVVRYVADRMAEAEAEAEKGSAVAVG